MSKYTPKFTKPTKRTKRPLKIRNIIRRSIMERDKSQCQICGNKAQQVHHIMQRSHSGNDTAMNLICLCSRCHRVVHSSESEWFKKLFHMQKNRYPNLTKKDLKR